MMTTMMHVKRLAEKTKKNEIKGNLVLGETSDVGLYAASAIVVVPTTKLWQQSMV